MAIVRNVTIASQKTIIMQYRDGIPVLKLAEHFSLSTSGIYDFYTTALQGSWRCLCAKATRMAKKNHAKRRQLDHSNVEIRSSAHTSRHSSQSDE